MTVHYILVTHTLTAGYQLMIHCPISFVSIVNFSFHDELNFSQFSRLKMKKRAAASRDDDTKFSTGLDTLQLIVSHRLRQQYRGVRHAAKLIASTLNCAVITARSYLDGVRTPSARNLIQLMADNEALQDDINRCVDAMAASSRESKKNNRLVDWRSEDADIGRGFCADTRMGQSQVWGNDYFSIRPRVVLVDIPSSYGCIQREQQGADAGPGCPDEGSKKYECRDGVGW